MKEEIIVLLSSADSNGLSVKEIATRLELDKDEVFNILRELGKETIVYKTGNERYTLVSKTDLKKGTIKITSRKGAIVVIDGRDYDIVYKDKNKLKNNDTVLVELYSQSGVAKVVKLADRKYYDYIGEVIKEGNNYKAICQGKMDIILKEKYPLGTRLLIDGETNIVKEVVGHKDDTTELEKEVLLLNGFPVNFSDKYMEELKSIPLSLTEEEIDISKRNGIHDIREIPLVTIDGDDTKDFDDAVGYYNNTIYISIANPNKYIKERSSMWEETLKRGISVYPPGCVNPMTHEYLSNGICSLIPKEDRYSVTVAVKIDNTGKPISVKIYESIMNNRKRMTYSEVNKYLEENTVLEGYENYTEILTTLYNEAMKVKNKMLNEGFLEFTSDEVKFFFENKELIDIKERHQGKAEELIEFVMLLNNMIMTNYFIKSNLPFISRYHDEPSNEKLANWNSLLKQRGYKVDNLKKYNTEDIKERQKVYKDSKEKVVLDSIAIRSQSKAKYSAFNIGHYALGLDAYSTFTSPIRRISDFINQRIYLDSIHYGIDYTRNKWERITPYIAKIATDSEKRADKVERQLDDIRKAEYMSKYIGNNYDAIVTEVYDNYIRVLIPDKMIYGKVYIDRRYYHLSKDRLSLHSNNGERILVGDSINAQLLKTNTSTGEIIFFKETNVVKEYNNAEKKNKKKVKNR